MYLIFEINTGFVFQKKEITEADFSDCRDMLIEIIDILNPKEPQQYNPENETWNDVEDH
jgi:hypothetical protein